jgi:hypothetical protein
MGVPGHNAARTLAADLRGAAPAPAPRRRPAGVPPVERLMAKPRARRALVRLARQPRLAGLVERMSRRR